MSVIYLPYTDTPEAAWIYKALPFRQQGNILTGAVKAVLYKFFFPVYLFLTVGILLIWNVQIIPEMLLGGLLIVLVTLIIVRVQKIGLPFTQAREMQQKGGTLLVTITGIFSMVIVVALVYLGSLLPGWGMLLLCLLSIGMIILSYRSLRKKKYEII